MTETKTVSARSDRYQLPDKSTEADLIAQYQGARLMGVIVAGRNRFSILANLWFAAIEISQMSRSQIFQD
ncbi:MAG: hypothetical protein AAFR26_22800 [Cyanobacteria bacterium J06626_4]